MASLRRKARSPYWFMKYTAEDGRIVSRSTKQTDRRAAMQVALEAERMAKLARRGELTQAVILKAAGEMLERTTGERLNVASIKDFFEGYLKAKEATGTAASTLNRYRPVLDGFVAFLPPARQGASISSLTATEIERWRDAEVADGKGPSTCDFGLKVISSVLNSAHRKGLTLSNPALAVQPLNGRQEERLPFTDEQVKALLAVASDEWRGMILFGFHAGLRLNDASRLTWENIDLDEGMLRFAEQKTAHRKRRGDPETQVPLHPDLLAWLKAQPAGIGSAPLFPTLHQFKTGSAGGLSSTFGRLMKEAGIAVPLAKKKASGKGRTFRKLGFHSLRHAFISRLSNQEVSADVRKALAGHSSDEIHRRYVHLDPQLQREAIGKLASVL
jgi:integrase